MNYLHLIKSIYKDPAADITLRGDSLNVSSLPGNKAITPLTRVRGSSHWDKARKEIKASGWKGKMTLALFADDLIVYTENPKESTKNLLELISGFSKVTGYKISTYTN